MIAMAIVLALMSAWVEIRLVRRIPFVNNLMTKGALGIDAGLINLVFSIGISLVMGAAFGVGGLIAFLGGLGSTVLTNIYYPNEESIKVFTSGIAKIPHKINDGKNSMVKVYNDFKQPIKDVLTVIKTILQIITYPFVLARKMSAAYTRRVESRA